MVSSILRSSNLADVDSVSESLQICKNSLYKYANNKGANQPGHPYCLISSLDIKYSQPSLQGHCLSPNNLVLN